MEKPASRITIFCKKPQQNRVSSPQDLHFSHNPFTNNHLASENSWHTSYGQRRIIKVVSK